MRATRPLRACGVRAAFIRCMWCACRKHAVHPMQPHGAFAKLVVARAMVSNRSRLTEPICCGIVMYRLVLFRMAVWMGWVCAWAAHAKSTRAGQVHVRRPPLVVIGMHRINFRAAPRVVPAVLIRIAIARRVGAHQVSLAVTCPWFVRAHAWRARDRGDTMGRAITTRPRYYFLL